MICVLLAVLEFGSFRHLPLFSRVIEMPVAAVTEARAGLPVDRTPATRAAEVTMIVVSLVRLKTDPPLRVDRVRRPAVRPPAGESRANISFLPGFDKSPSDRRDRGRSLSVDGRAEPGRRGITAGSLRRRSVGQRDHVPLK